MEPRNHESQKVPEPRKQEQEHKRRFQIVKLEERIAPSSGGGNVAATWGCHQGSNSVTI